MSPSKLCRDCGMRMEILEEGQEYHILCGPRRIEDAMKDRLKEVVRWADSQDPRTQQVGLGPSELGADCTRYLAYRIAGVQGTNVYMDPWKALVGTAIHAWLEQAVNNYQEHHGLHEFVTEAVVPIDDLVTGHSDLFWRKTVWDYKTMSKDKLKHFRNHGPQDKHVDQVQLYGLGQERLGRQVEWVGIIALPRDGWLEDMSVWATKYDRNRALEVLKRPYDVAGLLMELDVENHPERWEDVPAAPSRLCGFCPFYRAGDKADETGCPGDLRGAMDRAADGLIIPKEEV